MQSPTSSYHTESTVHFPNCDCACGPVTDYTLREFSNGDPLHVYRYCRTCGKRATSNIKRTSIPLSKWAALCAQRRQKYEQVATGKILDTYWDILYNTLNAEAQSGMIGQVQIAVVFFFLTAGCLQKTKGFRVIQKDSIMTFQITTVTLGLHIQAVAFSYCCYVEAHLPIRALSVSPHSRKASNDPQKSITFQKLKHLTTRIKPTPLNL